MALPAQPLVRRKKLIGGAAEATPGTSVLATVSTPLASTLIYDAKMVPVDLTSDGKRAPDGHYMGNITAVVGQRAGRLTFRQELRNGDQLLTLLTGCGYKSDVGTYKPVTSITDHKAFSFKLWEDGRYKSIIGAMGTCRIGGSAGGRVFADWEWTGIWQAPVVGVMPASAAVTSATTFLLSGATLAYNTAAIGKISTLNVDLGNTVGLREDITGTSGLAHAHIEGREPGIEVDPEAHLIADSDPHGGLLAMTTAALSVVITDGTNTLTIAAPKAQYIDVGDDERGSRLVDTARFQCNADAGDDELSFDAA